MRFFCWHDWSNWSAAFDSAHCYTKLQSRFCTKCGKAHVAKIKQPWNQWFRAADLGEKK